MKKTNSLKQAPEPEELADALVPVAFATMAVLNRVGAENDLSLTLVRVLGILLDRRPRITELADYLGLEKHTMSGLIARAEKKGLLMRAPNADDGRATDVFLTSEGTRLVKQLRSQTRQALAPLFMPLDASDRHCLQELLWRMLEARKE